jgi:DNA/RNA endonuclease G (NUC1)
MSKSQSILLRSNSGLHKKSKKKSKTKISVSKTSVSKKSASKTNVSKTSISNSIKKDHLIDIIYKPCIKSIFGHNRHRDPTIIFIKKQEYDIFYSGRNRYPILVKESITINTGRTNNTENIIDRRQLVDPFKEDLDLPPKVRLTLLDYEKYMPYGGSMGHNAPAGQHKSNMDIYSETFLLSNISPQDIVLNTGLWVLLENWCKNLSRNNKLANITIFTGSIPAPKATHFDNGLILNIPLKMYKIVVANHINQPGKVYMDIFITNNAPYYINQSTGKCSLHKYLVPLKSYNWFQNFSGIDIKKLFDFYGLTGEMLPLQNIVNTDFILSDNFKLYMKKSEWFGKIVYSKSLEELEKMWTQLQLHKEEFENLEFHEQYYNAVKTRFIQ